MHRFLNRARNIGAKRGAVALGIPASRVRSIRPQLGRLCKYLSFGQGWDLPGEVQMLSHANGALSSNARKMRGPPPADPRLKGCTNKIFPAEPPPSAAR